MKALLRRVLDGVDGQDLIEYLVVDWDHHGREHAGDGHHRRQDHAVLLEPERRHALRARDGPMVLRDVGAILMAMTWCRSSARRAVRLLRQNDDGQDLIEYTLLTAIIAIAGILVFPTIQTKMAAAYQGWNTNAQAIWETPPPM